MGTYVSILYVMQQMSCLIISLKCWALKQGMTIWELWKIILISLLMFCLKIDAIYVDASRMEDQSGFGIFIHDSITLKAIFIQAKSFLIPLVFKLNLQVSIWQFAYVRNLSFQINQDLVRTTSKMAELYN